MFKKLFTTISIITMTMILVPASAEQDADTDTVKSTTQTEETSSAITEAEETTAQAGEEQGSVMNLPVDFSSPEMVEESMEKVRQQAGDDAARDLSNALGYILAYDISLRGNKEKMYEKLNGRTPNAIIAKMKR